MEPTNLNRRDFIKTSAAIGAGAVLTSKLVGAPHVAGSDKLRIGLVGCGGRGTGAVADALAADPSTELVAMSDLFADRVDAAIERIQKRLLRIYENDAAKVDKILKAQINVKPDNRFSGWDNHLKVCQLDEVDYIVTATPPVFRPHVVQAALDHNKHLFIEKPVAVDAAGCRWMYQLADLADQKKLCVVSGTQRRYHAGYQEALKRIQDGQIGDIVATQAYWMSSGFVGIPFRGGEDRPTNDMEFQVRNWLIYVWGSGDNIVEQHIHNMDVVNWMVGKMPNTAFGVGGRALQYNGERYGDRFSHYAVEYDYGDDLMCTSICRQEHRTKSRVGERIQGTKGTAHLTLRNQEIKGAKAWKFKPGQDFVPEMIAEHQFLINAIRDGKHVNTIREVTDSTLTMIAGRMSAFTGMQIKVDWVGRKSKEDLTPKTLAFGGIPIPELRIPGQVKLV